MGAALQSIAQQIVNKSTQYGTAATSAGAFLRGAISAAAFADVLLAVLGPAEIALLLAGVGITIAALALAIYCWTHP